MQFHGIVIQLKNQRLVYINITVMRKHLLDQVCFVKVQPVIIWDFSLSNVYEYFSSQLYSHETDLIRSIYWHFTQNHTSTFSLVNFGLKSKLVDFLCFLHLFVLKTVEVAKLLFLRLYPLPHHQPRGSQPVQEVGKCRREPLWSLPVWPG